MAIPSLKKVTVTSETGLRSWLAKNDGIGHSVMLVTHVDQNSPKFVSREQIADVVARNGWQSGMRYTLTKSLLGHVVTPASADQGAV